MSSEQCEHPIRVKGKVECDFIRPEDSEGPVYSATIAVGVCERCGHIEFHAMFQNELCEWLKSH